MPTSSLTCATISCRECPPLHIFVLQFRVEDIFGLQFHVGEAHRFTLFVLQFNVENAHPSWWPQVAQAWSQQVHAKSFVHICVYSRMRESRGLIKSFLWSYIIQCWHYEGGGGGGSWAVKWKYSNILLVGRKIKLLCSCSSDLRHVQYSNQLLIVN